MLTLLATLALAAPERLAATFEVGTDVTDITATADARYAAWVDGGGGMLTVLDLGSFDPITLSVCEGARGLAALGDSASGWAFLVGCGDGKVARVDVDTGGEVKLAAVTYPVGSGPVLAVETDGETLWAIVEEGGGAIAAAVTLADGASVEGFGQSLSNATVEDTVLTSDSVVVVHGADEVSKVSRTAGTVVTPTSTLGRQLVDGYPYTDGNAVYLADEGGGLVRFESDNDYVPLTIDADTVTAVGLEPVEGWMVLGAGDDALVYDFDGGTLTAAGTIEGAANLTELVAVEGYALGITSDGTALVLTDRPWVTVDTVDPSAATDGDTVTVTFSTDVAGRYYVYAGGTVDDLGPLVASGDVDADTPTTASFEVGEGSFEEGVNRVWVFVESGGLTGRGAGSLSVDNPPEKVAFGPGNLGFGNGALTVSFDGLTAADIVGYIVYIDVKPFSAADFPTGGPAFTGDDPIDVPILLVATPGGKVTKTIQPLTNGLTYYVAVRAYDAGGLEGPMSDVQSETPEQTYSATELAGEEGGYFPGCGVTRPGAAGGVGLALALAALLRRRGAALAVVGAVGVGLVPTEARADDDEGPRTMNVQLRYGPATVAEPYIQQVFGDDSEILWLEYGYASRFVDANVGLGFWQELGFRQTAEGRVSDEHDMFTMFPLALTVTGRLDFFDEQPIVPFGRIGLDYWMWRENWYVADSSTMESERTGGKYGWHYGGGLLVLLDVLDRRAASRLEATTGINDTYLVAEYRQTNLVHGDDQVNLSTSELTFGLKFDF